VKTLGQIFSQIIRNGFVTWTSAFYSAIRSELGDISAAVSAGGEILVQSAFMTVRHDRGT